MARRCPDAEPVGRVRLDGYRLAFRRTGGGYLTILPDKGNHVDGLLWKVSAQDEQALNHYEGFPHFYARLNVGLAGILPRLNDQDFQMYPDASAAGTPAQPLAMLPT